jgi:1,4-dihydroxy-6-naphthoate synthase
MKPLSLGYSPCPNDTFIFYALVHKKITDHDLSYNEILQDVETLNQMAGRSELDITKASFHAYGLLRDQYCLLRSGGALGKGCGPLVVSREDYDMKDLRGKTIAIPGVLTTAFLLLQLFDISLKNNIKVMPFNKIIDSVKNGDADAGLIIHESRFTFQRAGLKKIIDLGEWWHGKTGLPLPLGGILARRALGRGLITSIDHALRKSIEYAFSHRDEPLSYIKTHSQEMEDAVIEQHINLYVNDYSLDIGEDGAMAVKEMFKMAEEKGIIRKSVQPLFVL